MSANVVEVRLKPLKESKARLEPEMRAILRRRRGVDDDVMQPIGVRWRTEEWDAPLDLRVLRPRAIDLRKLWKLTKQKEPPGIAATLGPSRPILLNHLLTPFPLDGKPPVSVWGLGYEFVVRGIDDFQKVDVNTVSVVPDDKVVRFGKLKQEVNLGLKLGGELGIPDVALSALNLGTSVSLSGASMSASTDQNFQFSVKLDVTLRKVVGAGVGNGGAMWRLFRQDEALDRPHPLLQTVLVPEGSKKLHCIIKTWAKQAGFLGTRWGAKFWNYQDQEFEIDLTAY